MPLGPGVRYRMKKTSGGKTVRLAFKGDEVVEAKNMKSGATHTMKPKKGRKGGRRK